MEWPYKSQGMWQSSKHMEQADKRGENYIRIVHEFKVVPLTTVSHQLNLYYLQKILFIVFSVSADRPYL